MLLADYLGCSVDYLLGRTDVARPLNIPKEFIEKIGTMSNRVYFIHEKDYDKVLKINDKAKAFDNSIMDKDNFLGLLTRYETPLSRAADANGYSIKPRDYVEFKKVYDVYVDSCFNDVLNKLKK